MFGPMKPLTGDEYNTIFSVTGIDIDGRREMLQNCFIPHIEACVKRFVVFVKAIPGFSQLSLADQIALVKGIFVIYYRHSVCHHHLCIALKNQLRWNTSCCWMLCLSPVSRLIFIRFFVLNLDFHAMFLLWHSLLFFSPSQHTHTHTQVFYGPFSGTIRVSRRHKKTSALHDARED